MNYGVREICDVVLKAKATQKVGKKLFYKNEPVLRFTTLKTSTLEGAANTVYATGGRGASRLIAWEGEKTLTFTMEDALISPEGFMILSGAGLIDAEPGKTTIKHHVTETIDGSEVKVTPEPGASSALTSLEFSLSKKPYFTLQDPTNPTYNQESNPYVDSNAVVMLVKDGEIVSEPFPVNYILEKDLTETEGAWPVSVKAMGGDYAFSDGYSVYDENSNRIFDSIIVDYYTEIASGAQEIDITPDKFGGNYYLEASTLFRDTRGSDHAAEFIIPNCKVQSNFTFTMAGSGDPSTFTFTMDAFPDFTRFDHSRKVLAAIQILDAEDADVERRTKTNHDPKHEPIEF